MENPTITLAGESYPVRPLVIRQLRVVHPRFARLRKMDVDNPSEQDFDDLVEVVYQAISPERPGLTREAFHEQPVSLVELLGALPAIAEQSGMLRKKEAEPGEATAGS